MNRIQVVVRASARHDPRALKQVKRTLLDGIAKGLSVPLQEVSTPAPDGLAAVLVLTGGVERDVLKLMSDLPSPVLLIAHDGYNALPASLEILARIRQEGGEGRILFGSPGQIAVELEREARIADAWHELRFSRVGVIGEPSEWLVSSDVDRAFLRGRLGIELIVVPIEELVERAAEERPKQADIEQWIRGAAGDGEVSEDDLAQAVAVYQALRSLIDEHHLNACAVRCFDVVDALSNTSCYAVSRLNDEGIPSACEGDLQSLFGLYIARLLTGSAAFMGNVASVDEQRHEAVIAHCTCPLSLVSDYALRRHFETGCGVGIQARIPAGPCTLYRLGGERLSHLFLREGSIVDAAPRDDRCRTQILAVTDGGLGDLLVAPLGNHHIVLPGRHGATLKLFHDRYLRTGLPVH
jgi:L-fucose isomerase-like protein